jgi:hypothetical protein
MLLIVLTVFFHYGFTAKVCEHWQGPGKLVLGWTRFCQYERMTAKDTADCLEVCRARDDCHSLYLYEDPPSAMTCIRVHSCAVPPTDFLFSDVDTESEPATWYSCNVPGEQPWEITQEPTSQSEFREKSCTQAAGVGQLVKDMRRKCDYLQIVNRKTFEDCVDVCKGTSSCNLVGIVTKPTTEDPTNQACYTLKCADDIEIEENSDGKAVWMGCEEGELPPTTTEAATLEPSEATQEPSEPPTCETVVPAQAEVTCDAAIEMINSGKCVLPTEAEVTTEPTTAAPTREMLWNTEGADRCPLAYKLGAWGHFGRTKNTKKCEKKCKSHPDCVAISWKMDNRACTGFSECPFFESTEDYGGNTGWINIRVKPEPSTSAFSASFTQAESWTVMQVGERALACVGLVAIVAAAYSKIAKSNSHSIYLQVEETDL